MPRKADHFDLAMEALGQQLCETEHRYVSTRLLLFAAMDRIVVLEAALAKEQHWHAGDVAQLRILMEVDAEA